MSLQHILDKEFRSGHKNHLLENTRQAIRLLRSEGVSKEELSEYLLQYVNHVFESNERLRWTDISLGETVLYEFKRVMKIASRYLLGTEVSNALDLVTFEVIFVDSTSKVDRLEHP